MVTAASQAFAVDIENELLLGLESSSDRLLLVVRASFCDMIASSCKVVANSNCGSVICSSSHGELSWLLSEDSSDSSESGISSLIPTVDVPCTITSRGDDDAVAVIAVVARRPKEASGGARTWRVAHELESFPPFVVNARLPSTSLGVLRGHPFTKQRPFFFCCPPPRPLAIPLPPLRPVISSRPSRFAFPPRAHVNSVVKPRSDWKKPAAQRLFHQRHCYPWLSSSVSPPWREERRQYL